MKKLISLVLALMMLFACAALAEGAPETEESPALSYEELQIYLAKLAAAALADKDLGVIAGADGPATAVFSGGVLYLPGESLTEDTAPLGVVLGREQADPRGLMIGDDIFSLLSVYPNDNPDLYGSYYDAALYMSGENPEVAVGYLLRDGQQITGVIHEVFSWQGDAVIRCRVKYELNENYITAISVEGMDDRLSQEEALAAIADVAAVQENTEYFMYPVDESGALAPFAREDLTLRTANLNAMDFLDMTAETAADTLGAADRDEWTRDETGDQPRSMRQMDWEGVSLLLVYTEDRNTLLENVITVTSQALEGPRGVRVGDTLYSVINRFHHEFQQVDEQLTMLYGDGQQAPYGALTYTAGGAEVQYALTLEDGKTVTWHMSFTDGKLDEMLLLVR